MEIVGRICSERSRQGLEIRVQLRNLVDSGALFLLKATTCNWLLVDIGHFVASAVQVAAADLRQIVNRSDP